MSSKEKEEKDATRTFQGIKAQLDLDAKNGSWINEDKIKEEIARGFHEAWNEIRGKKDDTPTPKLTILEERIARIINRFPAQFGKVEKETPIYSLIESLAYELNDFNFEFKKYREEIFEQTKEYIHKAIKKMDLNMNKVIREEVRLITKEKTALETELFMKELESL